MALVQTECAGGVLLAVGACAPEAVDGDDKRDAAVLEVVDGRETVLEPPGVRDNDRSECALGQLVPRLYRVRARCGAVRALHRWMPSRTTARA